MTVMKHNIFSPKQLKKHLIKIKRFFDFYNLSCMFYNSYELCQYIRMTHSIGINELGRAFSQEFWDRTEEVSGDINIEIDSFIQQYGSY